MFDFSTERSGVAVASVNVLLTDWDCEGTASTLLSACVSLLLDAGSPRIVSLADSSIFWRSASADSLPLVKTGCGMGSDESKISLSNSAVKKGPKSSSFSSSLTTLFRVDFAEVACRFTLVSLVGAALRARFTGLTCSRLRCGEACPPAFTWAARAALVSFLPVGGACAVTVEVWVVAVVAADVDVVFARDEARVLVTVCCDSITTCGSALVEVALVFRAFFLGTSGGGVPCCELCSEADSAASVEAAAAAVRRVERRVAVADMLGSCYTIAGIGRC